ncbi:MAG: hypothetical protein JWM28_2036 [Chitinophagaceae bacterium]|nr:hypothetical protein [Chitinophagaceae bacterium]
MIQIGFQHIETIYFPKDLVDDIYKEIQETGAEGYERLALCAGEKTEKEFRITRVIYPKQTLRKTPSGVSFHVSGEELERIGDLLYETQLSLIAQVHSHPTEAYHSEADDNYAIITRTGGLSIVIPDFGTSDSDFENSAFYRLYPDTGWTSLSKQQASMLIKITT